MDSAAWNFPLTMVAIHGKKHDLPKIPSDEKKIIRRYPRFFQMDPEQHGSAFIWLSWLRIGIRNSNPDPGAWKFTKITNKPGFLPFEKAFVPW